MIGQKNLLKQIDKLIENEFPRFTIITGQKGQGKKEVIKYIKNKLNDIPMCYIDTNIDAIRSFIEMTNKLQNPCLYVVSDADNMSLNAKNSLLKLVEEPPQQAIIVMTLQDINNTLETIKSRCIELKMENYTQKEIDYMIDNIKDIKNYPLTLQEKSIVDNIAQNYYQVELLFEYGIEEFYNYVEKVVNNIYKVQSANSFKIAEKLDIKGDGNGYDLNLFFETYKTICMDKLSEMNEDCEYDIFPYKEYGKSIEVTSKYQQKLNINRNKSSSIT